MPSKDKLREWTEVYNCGLVNKDRLQLRVMVELPDATITAAIAREITKALREQNKLLIKRTIIDRAMYPYTADIRYEIIPKAVPE